MKIINKSVIVIAVFQLIFISSLFAKTEILFSPQGLIQKSIIEKIDSAEHSIDIAVFVFSSGDIAEKLFNAKERGVKIRMLLDSKQGKMHNPVLDFLNDENFDLKYLKGTVGGFMHNTFAVFDKDIIVTGSYNWTEHSEKFNYENALFIDDPGVVGVYQNEFELLYQKGVSGTHKNNEKVIVGSETSGTIENEFVNVNKDSGSVESKPSIESQIDFLNYSFEMFDDLFGEHSRLDKAEKKELWKGKFKGKSVKWDGKVCYKGVSVNDWNKVGVSHNDVDSREADVELRFDWTKRVAVKFLKIGEMVTYTGTLTALRGFGSPYKVIDGNILERNK